MLEHSCCCISFTPLQQVGIIVLAAHLEWKLLVRVFCQANWSYCRANTRGQKSSPTHPNSIWMESSGCHRTSGIPKGFQAKNMVYLCGYLEPFYFLLVTFKKYIILFCVCGFFACMYRYVYQMYLGAMDPPGIGVTAMWVLEIKPSSSKGAASVLNHSTVSPTPKSF